MHSQRSLEQLCTAVIHRAYRLRILVKSVPVPVSAEGDRLLAFAAIEAMNLWTGFARSHFISCALRARSGSGTRIAVAVPGLQTVDDAILFAARATNPRLTNATTVKRRDEPTWHDPAILVKLFTASGATNTAQVQAALSYPSSFFQQLPTVRNFFAHRNEGTAVKVQAVARANGLNPKLRPSEVVWSRAPGRPQGILADWIDDVRNVAELMCR